jgi:hypothetical protein
MRKIHITALAALSALAVGVSGAALGISTDVKPRTADLLTFVYELPDGRITTSGTARLAATGTVFDEQFAITGGTGKYQSPHGNVRVVQETMDHAKLTFHIQR